MADTKFTAGPWVVGYKSLTVGIPENAKIGGFEKLFDVRGWGYFTGLGHGALGMSAEDATTIQNANAHLIAAAPELYESLYRLVRDCEIAGLQEQAGFDCWINMANKALAKARGEAA